MTEHLSTNALVDVAKRAEAYIDATGNHPRLALDLRNALRATALDTGSPAIEMVTDLDRALHGTTWARPQSTQEVWRGLLVEVAHLAYLAGANPQE